MIIKMLVQYVIYIFLGILGIIFLGILTGCGQSPTGPPPPVLHATTFEEHIEMMKTPGHVAKWLDQFSKYSDPYTGWYVPEGKDLAWSLAHDFWENYIEGFSRGKCGSFAAMQAVCARHHGYKAGIIVWYHWDNQGGAWGHAEAWVQEKEGISVQSNNRYDKEIYINYDDMLEEYKKLHVNENGYLIMYDAYWNDDTKKEYVYNENFLE